MRPMEKLVRDLLSTLVHGRWNAECKTPRFLGPDRVGGIQGQGSCISNNIAQITSAYKRVFRTPFSATGW
jgi:hypothetical protein